MFGLTLLLAHVVASTAYVWPSPKLDALEAMRWDQDDTLNGFAPFAYHDMATHNVEDGTGGLDASIRFRKSSRNAGTSFFNTLAVFVSFTTRHLSLADLIAIGAVTAIENCGGPQIAFRGGRVDSGEPNASSEPQQDLQSHIVSFSRQGFTQTEMISLIACGHSFSSVEHKAFPDVVTDLKDPNNTLTVAHFDSTFDFFDNNVATEYISGTTQNPLVVSANDTTNSDKRIFASDGNATMSSFAKSPELFASTCATLFALIEPLPVRPASIALVLHGDALKLSGLVRFWGLADDPTRTVQLLWDDRAAG
ncbi:heme peroxidase [Mycena olivaceomarginata]|nr:heme peroxidase [Mycena olivaceomarginata]